MLGEMSRRMRQECNHGVEEVLIERDDLQVCLDLTASKLSRVHNSLMLDCERLSNIVDVRPPAICVLRRWLCPQVPVAGFLDRIGCLGIAEVDAHCARTKDIVASGSGSLELDSPSVVELLWAAVRRDLLFTGSSERSRTPSSVLLVPGNN